MTTLKLSNAGLKEREALKQFRQRIPDLLENFNDYRSNDAWLRRWIVAREYNVSKAEEMLRKYIQWRKDHDMDTIMEWKAPDLIGDKYPSKASGFDKDGCVVTPVPFGRWDVRKVVSLGLKNEFLKHVDQTFEQAMRLSEFRSTPDNIITQFVIILDFEGFALRQVASRETIETVAEIIRRFESNHPETLKAAWVVNAPKYFEILFALVKPLLTARTMSKVRIFGSNSDQWRPLLLENIEPDQLPSQYGGTNTTCKNYKVSYGFDIFPVYEVFPEEEMVAVTVDAGQKHFVEFSLSKGSQLSWNFQTLNYDIGFSVCFDDEVISTGKQSKTTNGNHMETLFTCARADSHLFLQKGCIVAEQRGTYKLVFDNSFSRFRSKKLFYAARVNSQHYLDSNQKVVS